jgi:hypothetical protein
MPWKKYIRFLPLILIGLYYLSDFSFLLGRSYYNEHTDIIFPIIFIAVSFGFALLYPKFSNKREKELETTLTSSGWNVTEETEPIEDLMPHLIDQGLISGPRIETDFQASKQIDNQPVSILGVRVIYHSKNSDRTIPLTVALTMLPGAVAGWAKLRPNNSFFSGVSQDISMESVQFNKEVDVRAKPKQLAWSIFTPDMMSYYLDIHIKPWWHVEGKWAATVVEWQASPEQIPTLVEWHRRLLQDLKQNGIGIS